MPSTAASDDQPDYSGALGAIPYAFRTSPSRLFRAYVVVAALFSLVVTLVFVAALVVLLARTVGAAGGTFTFSRAFFVAVGFAVVAPTVAPVLLVARRHRRGQGDARYDAALALSGYVFLVSLYAGLLISAPPGARDPPPDVLEPVVGTLYALPPAFGLVPPVLAIVVMVAVYRVAGDGR